MSITVNIGTAAVLYTLHDTFDPLSLEGQKCHEASGDEEQKSRRTALQQLERSEGIFGAHRACERTSELTSPMKGLS